MARYKVGQFLRDEYGDLWVVLSKKRADYLYNQGLEVILYKPTCQPIMRVLG